jgi:hypothetical protein
VSVLTIPEDLERDWWESPRSAYLRRKVRRALKLGYEFAPFDFRDHRDDVHAINNSKQERQGKPMSATYAEYPPAKNPFRGQTCPRHRHDYVGVFQDGRLYAYALLRQCGEMVLFSEILGHGDRLDDGIMYLLVYESVKLRKKESGTQYAVYHLQDAGTPGLQYFKAQAGFTGYSVDWRLAPPGIEVPTFEYDPDNPEVMRVVSDPSARVVNARQSGKQQPARGSSGHMAAQLKRGLKAGLRRAGLLGPARSLVRYAKGLRRRRPSHMR